MELPRPKNFASLRESKKEEAMPASKRGSGYESGRYLTPRRKDAKEERREEMKKASPSKKTSLHGVN
jgi:hypothetical protein